MFLIFMRIFRISLFFEYPHRIIGGYAWWLQKEPSISNSKIVEWNVGKMVSWPQWICEKPVRFTVRHRSLKSKNPACGRKDHIPIFR
jgi:hypothetical protein